MQGVAIPVDEPGGSARSVDDCAIEEETFPRQNGQKRGSNRGGKVKVRSLRAGAEAG